MENAYHDVMDRPRISDEELKQTLLFSGLTDTQLRRLKQCMRVIHLEPGERLFEYGETARRFFLVHSGQIKLFRISPEGMEKVIEIFQRGQTFAEAVMFMENQTYPVNAEAIVASEVLAFENKVFLGILRESVDSCFRLMADMSMRLKMRLAEIEALTLRNATLRMVNYLLRQIPEGSHAPVDIELLLPKNVIASRLSVQPETFSRILRSMSKAGVISIEGARIRVLDVEALRLFGESSHI